MCRSRDMKAHRKGHIVGWKEKSWLLKWQVKHDILRLNRSPLTLGRFTEWSGINWALISEIQKEIPL